jgi:hypothetical protein
MSIYSHWITPNNLHHGAGSGNACSHVAALWAPGSYFETLHPLTRWPTAASAFRLIDTVPVTLQIEIMNVRCPRCERTMDEVPHGVFENESPPRKLGPGGSNVLSWAKSMGYEINAQPAQS